MKEQSKAIQRSELNPKSQPLKRRNGSKFGADLKTNLKQSLKDKATYEFEIAGLPYKLKSSHDEQTVQELVDFVDQKVSQALSVTKSGSFQSAAVLAALNIAEELILLKRKAHRELDILEEKTLKLAESLEHSRIPQTSKQGLNY